MSYSAYNRSPLELNATFPDCPSSKTCLLILLNEIENNMAIEYINIEEYLIDTV